MEAMMMLAEFNRGWCRKGWMAVASRDGCEDWEHWRLMDKRFKTDAVAVAHVKGPQSLVSFYYPLRAASTVHGNRIDELAVRVATIEATYYQSSA